MAATLTDAVRSLSQAHSDEGTIVAVIVILAVLIVATIVLLLFLRKYRII